MIVYVLLIQASMIVNVKDLMMKKPTNGGTRTDGGFCCPSLIDTPLAQHDAVELGRVLSALGDPVRLRLLSLVAAQSEVCSCDLEVPLGKTQPTISHHTRVLVEAGLITGEKRGRWVWWRVEEQRLAAVRRALGG